jgi:hypothetical protein
MAARVGSHYNRRMREKPAVPEGESELQFDRAEPSMPEGARACGGCKQSIEAEYYAVAGHVVCPSCTAQFTAGPSSAEFLRALVLGTGAAVLGTLVWYLIYKFTGSEFGLIAIGVGLLVGFAVRKGARGRGGWKYQTLAIVLTYVSISASYMPTILSSVRQEAGTQVSVESARDVPGDVAEDPAADRGSSLSPLGFVVLFGIALASPFLAGVKNFMGLLIIAFALYEAWKINKRADVTGPFRIQPPVAPAEPGVII